MVILKTKTGMIPANETEVLFTDVDIEDESIIEVYYDSNDVYTVETSQNGDNVLVVVSEHTNPVGVKLLINNVTSFSPYDDARISARIDAVEEDIQSINTEIETLDETLNERVPSETLLGSVLYHGTTGNTWKKLNANNLDYDENSTIYSAMGDIDSLDTTSKNLVGAINEVKSSGGGSQGEIYDSTERVIGTWFGKTLYRKVVVLSSSITLPSNTWVGVQGIDLNVVEEIVKCAISVWQPSNKSTFYPLGSDADTSDTVKVMNFRNITITAYPNSKIIFEYTKVGD